MKKSLISLIIIFAIFSCKAQNEKTVQQEDTIQKEWISLFNGKNLEGWFVKGKATWDVRDGILTGDGGMGHIYTEPEVSDFEVKGIFRISEKGNSGLYFRANPPQENPDGWPAGYEAQIDNHQEAHTGYLWKPGNPTAKAKKLITKDNEWFEMRVKMVGEHLEIWVNDELMTEYDDADYKKGHFAIQGHNPGQIIEIKELSYLDLDAAK